MTEISDLDPAPVHPPAEASITAGQISLYLAEKGAHGPCEACGCEDWRAHDESTDDTTAIMLMNRDAPSGASGCKMTVTVICRGCGLVRQFVRAVVAQWVQEHRHG